MDAELDVFKMDKSTFSITSLLAEPDEKTYWIAQTPYARLQAVELMR